MELAGKVAIVTGSGGEGSGRAEARRLAAEGCHVVVSDINESGGRETQRLIASAGGQAFAILLHSCSTAEYRGQPDHALL